jgi:SAM-dependent methyltransferase
VIGCQGNSLSCRLCGVEYAVAEGIPLMLPPEFEAPGDEEPGDGSAVAYKRQQASFTDEGIDEDWEIRRPHGAPAFYGWLIEEKFRRSLVGLAPLSPGTTVLAVCGGSGLDAEFLARTGARVLCTDISLEAAKRTRERARRFGIEMTPVVADAENLPFADQSVEIVYVHDGLHHLEDPVLGLTEMARVAARAVSVNEPAVATVTAIAVRLGLALEREEAGNRVARLTLDEITDVLQERGFRTVEAHRYAMYYKHAPGRVMWLLSRKTTLPIAKAAVTSFNRVAGRIGNKLTVQAVRPADGIME